MHAQSVAAVIARHSPRTGRAIIEIAKLRVRLILTNSPTVSDGFESHASACGLADE